jgi:hypothetical protein
MAQIYPLELKSPDDVILTDVLINKHTASFILDTGATNTIIRFEYTFDCWLFIYFCWKEKI